MSRPPRKSGPGRPGGPSSGGGGGRKPPAGGGRGRSPSGERPRFARDGDAPKRPYQRREEGDRPRPARDFGDRPRTPRDGGDRPRFARDGDAPKRPYQRREEGDRPRPARDFGDRPRPSRDGGDRPRFSRDSDAPRKSYAPRDGDAPKRPYQRREEGDRPARPARDFGDRPRPSRDFGDRPRTPRDFGDRPPREEKSGGPPKGPRGKPDFKRIAEDEREARRMELQREARAKQLADRAELAEQFPKRDELVRKRRATRAVEAVLDERKRSARKAAATRFRADEETAAPRSSRAPRAKLTAEKAAAPAALQPVKLAPANDKPERIAKRLARAGVGSRRDVEIMIAEGRIAIDGVELTQPAHNVTSLEGVTLDGNPVSAAVRTTLYAFYKPVGCVTSARDEDGRTTVFDLLPEDMPRVISIGRLDYNTEGLLLLTNDGELARHLELPENHYPRSYRVRVFGRINDGALERLAQGVTIDGVRYGEVKATLERSTGSNHWLGITIYEGKNREVRRICEHLGLTVSRLIRVGFGPFALDELKEGMCVEIERSDWTAELPPPFGHGRKPRTPEGVKAKHIPRKRDADHRG